MTNELREICAARLPIAAIAALANLRCLPGITVVQVGDRAWLRWPAGEQRVLERVLALSGVELFVHYHGGWSRWGSLLPAEGPPANQPGQPLAHVLTPVPVAPVPPGERAIPAVRLRLVRSNDIREASAMRCRASDLLGWSERVPSSRLAELRGVRWGDGLLLLGSRLPEIAGGQRFWGENLLLPLGWRAEPDLPEHACRRALGLEADDILLFTEAGAELIARSGSRPLTRAVLRLAAGAHPWQLQGNPDR